jgi:hypothetical protein
LGSRNASIPPSSTPSFRTPLTVSSSHSTYPPNETSPRQNQQRIALPVRVEPKVFFANERTFLSWLHFAVVLGGLAVGLLNFGDKVGKISAGMYTVVGEFLWMWMWMWRDDVVVAVVLLSRTSSWLWRISVEDRSGREIGSRIEFARCVAHGCLLGKARRVDRFHK